MLHYVHRLVANCVFLPFSAGQVVYRGFVELKAAAHYDLKLHHESVESEPKM